MSATVRAARDSDEADLGRIDRETWTSLTSPAPPPPAERRFFDPPEQVRAVLVAEVDGLVAGYVRLEPSTPLESSRFVFAVKGIAVDPAVQGRGVGRALMGAAIDEAKQCGARKLTLRVLGHNEPARALYERCGFAVEGILRAEFHLDGRDVDDIFHGAVSLMRASIGVRRGSDPQQLVHRPLSSAIAQQSRGPRGQSPLVCVRAPGSDTGQTPE